MPSSWQMLALLSAGFAALAADSAKIGGDSMNSDYATLNPARSAQRPYESGPPGTNRVGVELIAAARLT